ncbi:septal ring lytic transglycosylase RlpA family protein [Cupriavidus gilardii]|uniref:septal ring lytic transglycosylase RlpA family protein n=1 Tax=Cupriavidus gilardii TaxID=82541 RepID=UPI000A9BA61F
MLWPTHPLTHARRALRYGFHAVCALTLAACAVSPNDNPDGAAADQNAAPTAATPAAKQAQARKSRVPNQDNRAAAGNETSSAPNTETPAPTGSWRLFSWGDDDSSDSESASRGTTRGSSLEGLRADIGTFEQRGTASWYGKQFHGRKTANGERFDMGAMTAAHPSLPLDSWVLVRNLRNDKVAVLRINDRGPYHGNRVLDVSYRAAKRLGFVDRGHTQVEIRRLSRTELAALGPLREPGMDDGATDGGGDGVDDDTAARTVKPKRVVLKTRKTTSKANAR